MPCLPVRKLIPAKIAFSKSCFQILKSIGECLIVYSNKVHLLLLQKKSETKYKYYLRTTNLLPLSAHTLGHQSQALSHLDVLEGIYEGLCVWGPATPAWCEQY